MLDKTSSRSRIYFDISEMLEYAAHHHRISGIQRFTLAVIAHILRVYPHEGFAIVAFHPTFKRSFEIDSSWCSDDFEFRNDEFARLLGLNLQRPWPYLKKYRRRPLTYAARFTHLAFSTIRRDGRYFRKRHLRPFFAGSRQLRAADYSDVLRPLQFRRGDKLVVLGATGGSKSYFSFLRKAVQDGAELTVYVHDVIPMVMPQFMEENVPAQFGSWMKLLSELVARFYVNSNATMADLRRVLRDIAPNRDPIITVVPLAHEFQGGRKASTAGVTIRTEVLAAARLPYVLVVGTIEIRKNVWGILRVWQQIIETMGLSAPRIIFVGRLGWMIHDFNDLRHSTGNLGGYLKIIEMASDAELEYLYRHCLFSLYPSYYEGWGLPIGESLWFGKTCVTSTTTSMPEVAQGMCILVEPTDLQALYGEVFRLISDPEHRADMERRIDRSRLRRWADVGDELRDAIVGVDTGHRRATAEMLPAQAF